MERSHKSTCLSTEENILTSKFVYLKSKFVYQVNKLLSSLGNRTVIGNDSSDISSAGLGIQFFIVKSMIYQFLYRLKNLYDFFN